MNNPKRSTSKNSYNHLKNEKSPYLIQHAKNPVDWYPWGDEAFEKAKKEDKPVFLSIGYSTCHWCHVMAHESFEDHEVAALMNHVFVPVKVDREERPDIDSVYMTACQIMTGTGGWPLTIILTPDKKPFFAGTYFPRESGFGAVGLKDLILNVQDIWNDNREEALNSGDQIFKALQDVSKTVKGPELDENVLEKCYDELSKVFDNENGGFGDFQKFPTPHTLIFLLRYWKRTANKHALYMLTKTLDSIAKGGIYDHLGFGFHRYSVDKFWLVPHFEKMLYDQALIAMVYTEAFQATGKPNYKKIAEEVLTYVLRDMKSSEGGFYSAEDADSEGVEGKFYLWTMEEIQDILGKEDTKFVSTVFDVKEDGNFSDDYSHESNNKNILHLKYSFDELNDILGMETDKIQEKIENIRLKLYNEREKRIHPHKDDKILTDWNGLMITSLAKAGQVFKNSKYLEAAKDAADFIIKKMCTNSRLMHRYREGDADITGNLDDYSFLIWGLLELYSTIFDTKYLKTSIELNKTLLNHFWDNSNGGFYFTSDDAKQVLIREKKTFDSATPSGNSVELLNLIRIARLTEDYELESMPIKMETTFSKNILRSLTGHTQFINAVDYKIGPSYEVVIVGKPTDPETIQMLNSLNKHYLPNMVLILKDPDNPGELDEISESLKFKNSIDDKTTAYICSSGSCKKPTTDVVEMLKLLEQ
ncbi:thioredoxin domain-containing protein [Methanobacterium sp. SMA-27]|uniref:thioredoxin domain-containing protein n=1 Tax=Methanobacterium sp. SMA-27 TaxID=1495336 RepID=UPI00064F4518|nr:thioredoxin domain-containing protein [Methanobacterium sp. SMA-27]